ncbi:MAG: hypothetical protein NDI82_00720 [Anaeromyxobacteraceae bacterium]|nr:hypothetical protein [Anaeromyxobacteraceae bacterium]
MKAIVLAALVSVVGLTGCASILNDQTQRLNVSASNGAEIKGTVNGQAFTGPGIVEVTRENKDKVFVTETPGCAKETIAAKEVDTKFFINILSGGVFGSSTDYGTEKMWKYDDNVVIPCK